MHNANYERVTQVHIMCKSGSVIIALNGSNYNKTRIVKLIRNCIRRQLNGNRDRILKQISQQSSGLQILTV